MTSNILEAIEATYGSLEQPNWAFVPKRIREGLYDDLVEKLRGLGSAQETTDQNEDCSRCLFIASRTESLTLRLSLVGKFACVHDARGRFFSALDLRGSAMGERLCRLLESSGVELIDESVLRTETNFGGEARTLYDVLFSSDGLIS